MLLSNLYLVERMLFILIYRKLEFNSEITFCSSDLYLISQGREKCLFTTYSIIYFYYFNSLVINVINYTKIKLIWVFVMALAYAL